MIRDPFIFTVTDLARFLGKSSVTVRGWERKGLIAMNRDSGGDRKLTMAQVRDIARIAHSLGRINGHRLELIEATATLVKLIEQENR